MIKHAIQIIDTIKADIKIEEKYKNNLTQLIKDKYPQIQQSIKEENHIIEYPEFDNFNEITKDNKCIGFFTTQTKTEDTIKIILTEYYIKPEHKEDKIIKDILFSLKIYPDIDVIIQNPPRQLIQTLESTGLALALHDGITYSTIKLTDTYENIRTTEDEKLPKHGKYTSNLYDKNTSTTILLKDKKISLSNPRKNEIKKYQLKPTKKIEQDYSNNVKLSLFEYKHHIDTLEFLFYKKQLELLTVDNIIGTPEKLNGKIIKQLEKHNKTIQEGLEIRDKIIESLNKHEITQLTIYKRFLYLLEEDVNKTTIDNNQINTCPICKHTINQHLKYCHKCGYNIYRQDLTEEVNKKLDDLNPLNIYDDITGLEYKFQRKIQKEGYNHEEVYQDQLEISIYQFLDYINQNPDYIALPPFDLINHIKPETVTEYLVDNNMVEKQINNKYQENFFENFYQHEKLPGENYIDKYIYKIKRKGQRYCQNNTTAAIFTNNLYGLDYYQFKRYAKNCNTQNIDLLLNEYTDKKLNDAIRYEDCQLYVNLVNIDAHRLMTINEKLFCTTIIKSIICSINTFRIKEQVTIKDEPIQIEIITLFLHFKNMISKYNFNELYNNAYDSIQIDKLKIYKQENKKIIKNLSHENIIETNKEITFKKIGIK